VGILVLAQPGETNLLNNRVDLTLVIDSPAAPPPGGFLPAPGAGLAAAAIAGPAAARFVQRRSSRKEDVRRRRGPRTISVIAVVLLAAGAAALLVPAPTSASFSDARQVPGPLNGVCVTCHTDPNGAPPLNAYGSDYFAERNATNGSVDWERFGALDSDADGYNNSVELAGGYLPGDPGSNPRTGMKYEGFTGSGITGLLTAGITLLALALLGIALGFRMLGARNRRLAEKEAEKVKTAQEEPSAGGAPKP
jgi:predicted ribosomally synthesized peptide with SipW-like signal peptide